MISVYYAIDNGTELERSQHQSLHNDFQNRYWNKMHSIQKDTKLPCHVHKMQYRLNT